MSKIDIIKALYIDAPIEEVWNIAYHKFSEVDRWLTAVPESVGTNPVQAQDTSCERQCTPNVKGFGKTREVLEYVNAEDRVLRYRIIKGLPGFVKSATNEWTHEQSERGTLLKMNTKMELKGFMGTIMGGLMKKQMPKVLQEALEDLKHYAEHGEPHPRKVKAAKKWAKKHLKKAA